MDFFLKTLERIGDKIGLIMLSLMMIHIVVDVLARNVFNAPIDGTTEIVSAYYMVGVVFLPLAYVTRKEGHLIVEVFTQNLERKNMAGFDLFAGLLTLIFLVVFCWASTMSAIENTGYRESWEAAVTFIEVWPSRWCLPFASFLFIFVTLAKMRKDLKSLLGQNDGEAG